MALLYTVNAISISVEWDIGTFILFLFLHNGPSLYYQCHINFCILRCVHGFIREYATPTTQRQVFHSTVYKCLKSNVSIKEPKHTH